MDWTDTLHRLLIDISNLTNRFDVDGRLMAGADVKLDRALFPLLARLGLAGATGTVDLANLVGRDHSTVSRQVARLEMLGLVKRVPSPRDGRVQLLAPSEAGETLLSHVAAVRKRWMEDHFRDWPHADRDQLLALLARFMQDLPTASADLTATDAV